MAWPWSSLVLPFGLIALVFTTCVAKASIVEHTFNVIDEYNMHGHIFCVYMHLVYFMLVRDKRNFFICLVHEKKLFFYLQLPLS